MNFKGPSVISFDSIEISQESQNGHPQSRMGTSSRVVIEPQRTKGAVGTSQYIAQQAKNNRSRSQIRDDYREEINAIINKGAADAVAKGAVLSPASTRTNSNSVQSHSDIKQTSNFEPLQLHQFAGSNSMPPNPPTPYGNSQPQALQQNVQGFHGAMGGPSGYAGPMPFPPNFQNQCWGVQSRSRTQPIFITSSAMALALLAQSAATLPSHELQCAQRACAPNRPKKKKCKSGHIETSDVFSLQVVDDAGACAAPSGGQQNIRTPGPEQCPNMLNAQPYVMIEHIEPSSCLPRNSKCGTPRAGGMNKRFPQGSCADGAAAAQCATVTFCGSVTPCRKPKRRAKRCFKSTRYLPLPFTPPVVMVNCSAGAAEGSTETEENDESHTHA